MAALRWLYRISDRVIYVLFAIGVLSAPFYRVGLLRTLLLGGAPAPTAAALAGSRWASALPGDPCCAATSSGRTRPS